MIEDYYEISEGGELFPLGWNEDNKGQNFKVIPIVGAQWKYKGKLVRILYTYNNPLSLLPDKSGVIATERSNSRKIFDDELVFYEPDGSERFRIHPPRVTRFAEPDSAYFYYVDFLKDGAVDVVFDESGDGHEYRAVLDLETGGLSDFRSVRV